jgi:hypothetical protein
MGMKTSSPRREILEQISKLDPEQQRKVLDFARALELITPHGVPGKQILHFAGAIKLDDLDLMSKAIEEGCENVDSSE